MEDDWDEDTDLGPEKLREVEDAIASELGLDPEALQAFKEMNREMDTVLVDAEEEVIERAGVEETRLTRRQDSKDHDVWWVEVDEVPVYRAQFCYYKGGVKLIASWLPDGLLRLNAN